MFPISSPSPFGVFPLSPLEADVSPSLGSAACLPARFSRFLYDYDEEDPPG